MLQRHVCLVLLCGLVCQSLALHSRFESPFDGWAGETYRPNEPLAPTQDVQQNAPRIQVISHAPKAFLYHNFLTRDEATHLRRLALPQMRRATVVAPNGSHVLDSQRTSFGTFIERKLDPVVSNIEKRIADWVHLPEIYQEDMQVIRYGKGQEYRVHMDILNNQAAGPRVATVLMYLAETEEGGETIFPLSQGWANHADAASMVDASPCARGKVGVKVKTGAALLFWSMGPDGKTPDPTSNHAACPVLKGTKWTAAKWIHLKPFRPEAFDQPTVPGKDPGLCADDHPLCATWAEAGQCIKNSAYMVGSPADPGHCVASCQVCIPCKAGDLECYNSNRHLNGYLVYDPAEV